MPDRPLVLSGCDVLAPMNAPAPRPKSYRIRQGSDRFAVLNEFVDCSMRGLTRAQITAWLALYRCVREGVACAAISDIARRSGNTERATKRALSELRNLGLIEQMRRGYPGQPPSSYRVFPSLKQAG